MLYLHIGTGKAGSTTIQRFLLNNRYVLPYRQIERFGLGNSWKIAASMVTEGNRFYWIKVRKTFDVEEYRRFCAEFWGEVENEVMHMDHHDFIASSEYIDGQLGNERAAVERLQAQLTKVFGKVKLLIYFRNQIDFVKSLYSQRVKGATQESRSFSSFVNSLDELAMPIYYAERYRLWGETFGWENVEAVVFDHRNFPNGSLIEDFCTRMGIQYENENFLVHQKRENVSPGYSYLSSYRHLNLLRLNQTWKRRAQRAIQTFVPLRGFPKEYDDLIVSKVSEGNKWLNENFFMNLPAKLPELD